MMGLIRRVRPFGFCHKIDSKVEQKIDSMADYRKIDSKVWKKIDARAISFDMHSQNQDFVP